MSKHPRWLLSTLCLICLSGWMNQPLSGQQASHLDVAYDDDDVAQKMDVYLAKSDHPLPAMVFIHGGGWRAGSKKNVPRWLKDLVNQGKASVISVEYRFTQVAPHPAQVNDCLRAIQFVRQNAQRWNIDPDRIGVSGGSAGGHLTAYVSLHDDVAKRDAEDPVARHSSRVTCGVSFAGPTDWTLLETIEHKHPAYRQLIGTEPGTEYSELPKRQIRSVSPITFASADDPPLMQVHGDQDVIVPIEHAERLHDKLKSHGVISNLVVIQGGSHAVAGAGNAVVDEAKKFVTKHLLSTTP